MKENEITDEVILQVCLRENGQIKGAITSNSWMELHSDIKEYLDNRYPDSQSYKETIYRIKKQLHIRPVCTVCGKPVRFYNSSKGFAKCCSVTCTNKSPEHIKSIKQTCLERYGGLNPLCDDSVKEKSKQTCLERYGVPYSLQSQEVREKGKQTCLKKYGTEMRMVFGSEEYSALIKQRYGVDNVFQHEDIKQKIKETCLEKYGVEHSSQAEEVKEKMMSTCIQKYGVSNYSKTEECKHKRKKTCLEKYGTEYYSSTLEFVEKNKQTCLQKYGVEFVSQVPEFLEKAKRTNLKRYGHRHALQVAEFKKKMIATKNKNHTWNTSQIEQDLLKYLRDRFPGDVEYQYRSDKYDYSCDYYIKSLDLYIELQGSWTHGRHPFDPTNQKDLDKLIMWKERNTTYYTEALRTWTIRDVEKRACAKRNNLRYLEIFSIKLPKCIQELEDKLKTLEQG